MTEDEMFQQLCDKFKLLNEEQQDYILGLMQTLFLAENSGQTPDLEDEDE